MFSLMVGTRGKRNFIFVLTCGACPVFLNNCKHIHSSKYHNDFTVNKLHIDFYIVDASC